MRTHAHEHLEPLKSIQIVSLRIFLYVLLGFIFDYSSKEQGGGYFMKGDKWLVEVGWRFLYVMSLLSFDQ